MLSVPDSDGVPTSFRAQRGTNLPVHWRNPRRVTRTLQRFEIQLRQAHTVPVEPVRQSFEPLANGRGAFRILQVHQLSPVKLSVLRNSRLLPPFRMIGPELLAD